MTVKIAINGFGRIGRLVLRSIIEHKSTDLKVLAINDLSPVETLAHLLFHDSIHGPMDADVKVVGTDLVINGHTIKVCAEPDPRLLPWKSLGIDVAMECSGHFTARDKAAMHLQAGARKVLVSAPTQNADLTVVYGVNHDQITSDHQVVSNASCTTNALAPMAHALSPIGVDHGYMTTIHAYTGDQTLVDGIHKDMRRARAAALSIIPTSTGAAKAVGLVLPELEGKLDGTAIRVPTANVSMIDFSFVAKRATTTDEINEIMAQAAKGPLKGVMAINELPLVSCDFNHNPHSCVFDKTQTQVINKTFCRVLAWYDNEWGFSSRMSDVATLLAQK